MDIKRIDKIFEQIHEGIQEIAFDQEKVKVVFEDIREDLFETSIPETQRYQDCFEEYQTKIFIITDYITKLEERMKKIHESSLEINNIFCSEAYGINGKQKNTRIAVSGQ